MNIPRLPALFALFLGVVPFALQAQPSDVIVSPDITVSLGGTLVTDENAAEDDLAGGVVVQNVGPIPANADVTAYHDNGGGQAMFSLDITVELPGGIGNVVPSPRDVISWDGVDYGLAFNGSEWGVPAGANVDAVTRLGNGNLVLSYDTTIELDGTTFADEDLIEVSQNSRGGSLSFSLFFDGSAAGLPAAVDVDAVHYDPASGDIYVSLDTGGIAGGGSSPGGIFADGFEILNLITFADEDLILFDGENWSASYDGDSEHAEWLAADLDAAFVTP